MDKATAEQILGLSGTYDMSQARARYRELVKVNHPDAAIQRGVDPDEAHRRMADINSAWSVVDRELRLTGTVKASSTTQTVKTATSQDAHIPTAEEWYARKAEAYRKMQENREAEKAAQKPKVPENIYVPERPKKTVFDVLRKIINLPLWRLGFIALGLALYPVMVGLPYEEMFTSTNAGDSPEGYFAWIGLMFATGINLFIPFVTAPAQQSCLWLVDKMEGLAPEPSMRYAIFGHLPYRLLFLAFGIWQYWDFATFHVADSGALDWPFHVLVFLVAACNFVIPIVTSFIRDFLVGTSGYD